MPRLSNEEITLTLNPATAQLVCAALKVISHLASGEPDDPDTAATAEAFEAYLSVMTKIYGDGLAAHNGPGWSITAAEVDTLAEQLEQDMLAIVHRNYRRTAEGFVRK